MGARIVGFVLTEHPFCTYHIILNCKRFCSLALGLDSAAFHNVLVVPSNPFVYLPNLPLPSGSFFASDDFWFPSLPVQIQGHRFCFYLRVLIFQLVLYCWKTLNPTGLIQTRVAWVN